MSRVLFLLITLMGLSAFGQETVRLPIGVSVTLPEDSPFRFIPPQPRAMDTRGMSVQQIVMAQIEQKYAETKPTSVFFDAIDGEVERVGPTKIRVTLAEPIFLALQDAQTGEDLGVEKRFRNFTVVYENPEKLDRAMELQKGDYVVFGEFDKLIAEEFMARMDRGETQQLLQEYQRNKLGIPTLITFDHLQLDLSFDKIGTQEGNPILHPKIVGTSVRLESTRMARATTETAITITNMTDSFSAEDPFVKRYVQAVSELQEQLVEMEKRGWDKGFRSTEQNAEVDGLKALVESSSNVIRLIHCRQVFTAQ